MKLREQTVRHFLLPNDSFLVTGECLSPSYFLRLRFTEVPRHSSVSFVSSNRYIALLTSDYSPTTRPRTHFTSRPRLRSWTTSNDMSWKILDSTNISPLTDYHQIHQRPSNTSKLNSIPALALLAPMETPSILILLPSFTLIT